MIQTQTFDYQDRQEELETIASALDLLMHKNYDEAAKILIKRQDKLTREPKLKLYGT